jgi:hypothetical protein
MAPTPSNGVVSGALTVGFANAHATAAAPQEMEAVAETMLGLTPAGWTMVAAILTSIWTILCIVRSFPFVGQKVDAFIAWIVAGLKRLFGRKP